LEPLSLLTPPYNLRVPKCYELYIHVFIIAIDANFKVAQLNEYILCRNVITGSHFYVYINLLKSTGYVMHHQFNIQQLYALPTLYLCVLYLSENKQQIVPLTA
jgi:hypothetical protein